MQTVKKKTADREKEFMYILKVWTVCKRMAFSMHTRLLVLVVVVVVVFLLVLVLVLVLTLLLLC